MTHNNGHRPRTGEITSTMRTRQSPSLEPPTSGSTNAAMRTQHTPDYTLLALIQGIPYRMPPTRDPKNRLTRAEHLIYADLVFLWCIGLTKPGRKTLYCLVSHRNQAKRLKLSHPTIARAYRKLERLNLIRTTRRWHKKTHMEISSLITPGSLIYKNLFSFPQARKKNLQKPRFSSNSQPN